MKARAVGVLLACAALFGVAACEGTEPKVPSREPLQYVRLDVELPVWKLGRWSVDAFTDTLRLELADHNVQIAAQPAMGRTVVLVNLGIYQNLHAVDVALVRGGNVAYTGRVLVPDESMTTLDKAAELVATVVVMGLRSLASRG